jgi:hypothetical protein
MFNIDIAKIMNISTERDSDTKNKNEIRKRISRICERNN